MYVAHYVEIIWEHCCLGRVHCIGEKMLQGRATNNLSENLV